MDLDAIIKVATLVLAAVAALVSWLNFRKSGSQKVAQFRKEWIENLRSHLAEYNSLRYKISVSRQRAKDADKKAEKDEAQKEVEVAYNRISYVMYYIRLMLNKGESLHDELSEIMTAHVNSSFEVEKEEREKFMVVCRAILKSEWEKTKGEM